jgi:hypothetical protein
MQLGKWNAASVHSGLLRARRVVGIDQGRVESPWAIVSWSARTGTPWAAMRVPKVSRRSVGVAEDDGAAAQLNHTDLCYLRDL